MSILFIIKWGLIIFALAYLGKRYYSPIKALVLKIKGMFSKKA